MSATATATRGFGLGRTIYGTGLMLMPGRFGRPWIGSHAQEPTAQLALRALGVRDAVLGIGALLTADDPDRQRPWLAAGAISDLVDGVATLAAGAAIPRRSREGVAAFAAVSALTGAILTRARTSD